MQTIGVSVALLGAVGCFPCSAWGAENAHAYPTKPVRLIVPFSPGGPTDVIGRLLAQHLADAWKQQVIVDNRPGAGSVIGTELVARSTPDGYTALLGNLSTHAINPAMHPKLSYDPARDFAPVCLLASSPLLLALHPSVEARTVAELVALAKSRPGKLTYASAGAGTTPHLFFEMFKGLTVIDVLHVPYKGAGPVITDLLGGQVQMTMASAVPLVPHIKTGRLRGLGVTSAKRLAALPELPTIIEAGIPGYDVGSWFGVFLPAAAPRPIVQQMNAESQRMLEKQDIRLRLANMGAEPAASTTPEQFGAYLKSEIARWSKVVRDSGAKVN